MDRALGRFSAKREIWKPGGNEMAVGENGVLLQADHGKPT